MGVRVRMHACECKCHYLIHSSSLYFSKDFLFAKECLPSFTCQDTELSFFLSSKRSLETIERPAGGKSLPGTITCATFLVFLLMS